MSDNDLNIVVPNLPESVTDATVAAWHKKVGDFIQQNEILVEIETDKIMLEVPSSEEGILEVILEQAGSVVRSGQVLGCLKLVSNNDSSKIQIDKNQTKVTQEHTQSTDTPNDLIMEQKSNDIYTKDEMNISPAIRKLIAEHNLNIENIQGSGVKGRITRQDIEAHIQKTLLKTCNENNSDIDIDYTQRVDTNLVNDRNTDLRKETRVVMNRLRKTIAERLLNVTNSTAMLTTFNEVNMQSIMKLRNKYNELFEKRHGTKLGFMSFYVKSVLEGLRRFPEINASIDGEEIVYRNYFDISIAVSTTRGLITPVLRNVDTLSISDIEKQIKFLAEKARIGKLSIEELKGGNFTITNGGVFGSLMSTPIINPPQSAILGMHAIKERPIALNGEIVILPMMYLALSYDHRLVDGKDAVNFLIVIKTMIEDPIRLILDI